MFRRGAEDSIAVQKTLDGDGEAFADLVARYLPAVKAFAMARLGSAVDAEDLCQETFLRAYKSLAQYDARRPFGPWLIAIARNLVRDRCAALARERHALGQTKATADENATCPDDTHAFLRQTLDQLEENDREILLLYYFVGKDTRQIATLLHISAQAAEKRLQRARRRLHDRIAEQLGAAIAEYTPKQRETRGIVIAVLGFDSRNAHATMSMKSTFGMSKVGFAIVTLLVVAAMPALYVASRSPQEREDGVALPVSSGSAIAEPASRKTVDREPRLPFASRAVVRNDGVEPTGESLHGRVIDATTGDPVERFRVHLIDLGTQMDCDSPMGDFELSELQPEYFAMFFVKADGYYRSDTVSGFVRELAGTVEIPLYPAQYVRGRVINDLGRPVQGASVHFSTNASSSASTPPSLTGPDGFFHGELPREEIQSLVVTKEGHVAAELAPDERATTQEIVLVRSGFLQCELVTPAQWSVEILARPIEEERYIESGLVYLRHEVGDPYWRGEFPPGDYWVTARQVNDSSPFSLFDVTTEVHLAPGLTTITRIEPYAGTSGIAGRVFAAGTVLQTRGLSISEISLDLNSSARAAIGHYPEVAIVYDGSGDRYAGHVRDGVFELENVPAGPATFYISVQTGAENHFTAIPVTLEPGLVSMIDTDVSIGSTIRFDPSNASAPLYEVTVSRLTPNGTTRTPQGLPVFQIASGRVGSKTIRGLAPGAYQISVHFNDGGLEQIESAMIAIRDDEEVVFPLP